MTSMLLTDRYAELAGCGWVDMFVRREAAHPARLPGTPGRLSFRARGLAFLRAVARRDLLFRRVLAGSLLDHLAHHRAVAGHEWRDLLEPRAVPHLELDHARALVIHAARLDRREEPGGAQVLDAGLGEIEVLEAPAQLLGRHHLALAELVLRDAKRIHE